MNLFPEWVINTLVVISGLTLALLIIVRVLRSQVRLRTVDLSRLNSQLLTEAAERRRAEALLSGQNKVLEMLATGRSLQESLSTLLQTIEDLSPGMLGSILLLDDDGIHVHHGAAPSLPTAFIEAVDGLPIGPSAGSCGTAAYRREAVYVEDIESDPLWANYRQLALAHGLRACWSTPIFDAQQRVLGTFAMYFLQPALPQPEQLKLIESTTHTATILINNYYAEQALRLSEQRLQLLIDGLGQQMFVGLLDTQGTVLMANLPALKAANLELSGVIGKAVQDTYWWTYSETVRERLCAAVERAAQGEFVRYDEQIRVTDEQLIWLDFNIQPLRDETGAITFLVPSGIVITERKQAERALRESEAKLRTIIESSPVAMAITDEHENFTFLNRKFLETFGYNHADIPNLDKWWPLAYPDPVYRQQVREEWMAAVEKSHQNQSELEPMEYKVSCRKGTVLDIRFSMAPIGTSSLVILYDLTERKQIEMAMLEHERRYRQLFDYAPDGIIISDNEGYYLDANASACTLLGYSRDELIGKQASYIVIPTEIKNIEPALEEIKNTSNYFKEWQLRRKDGSSFCAEVTGSSMPDGSPFAVIRDITERKQAEQNIREQLDELLRWQTVTLTREQRVEQLKIEVNELLTAQDQPPRYQSPKA